VTESLNEKFHWFVVFRKGSKGYLYQFRTVQFMTLVIKEYWDKHADYPFAIHAYTMDGDMYKVDIT